MFSFLFHFHFHFLSLLMTEKTERKNVMEVEPSFISYHEKWGWNVVAILFFVSVISHISLLIVKLDGIRDYTYFLIIVPILIGLVIVLFWALILSLTRGLLYLNAEEWCRAMALVSVTTGAIWTYALLAQKFEADIEYTFGKALIPFIFGASLAILFYLASVAIYSVNERGKTIKLRTRKKRMISLK